MARRRASRSRQPGDAVESSQAGDDLAHHQPAERPVGTGPQCDGQQKQREDVGPVGHGAGDQRARCDGTDQEDRGQAAYRQHRRLARQVIGD